MSITTAASRATETAAPRAITTPLVDAICIGGASIVVLTCIFAFRLPIEQANWDRFFILALLINQPHFMASYRLLYQSKEQVLAYKWASIYVPALLVAYGVLTVLVFLRTSSLGLFDVLDHLAAVYLAWHYTGQSWGMTASFAYIGGVRFTNLERALVKNVFRMLLTWHVIIYIYNRAAVPEYLPWLRQSIDISFHSITIASHVAAALGLGVLVYVWYRTGGRLPLRAFLPLPALYLGYLLLARTPAALFVLQMSHALQYLIFPMRVEMNRRQRQSNAGSSGWVMHMTVYFACLVAAGWLVFSGPTTLGLWASGDRRLVALAAALVAASVNIHHYFTDGCVWKISNPRVRKELFRHLQEPDAA